MEKVDTLFLVHCLDWINTMARNSNRTVHRRKSVSLVADIQTEPNWAEPSKPQALLLFENNFRLQIGESYVYLYIVNVYGKSVR